MSQSPTTIASTVAAQAVATGSGKPGSHRRRRDRLVWWVVLIIGVTYFVLPLFATFQVSLGMTVPFKAYTNTFNDPKFWYSLLYSAVCAIGTILLFGTLALFTFPYIGQALNMSQPVFGAWAGTENLEERVDGIDRIDPVVLAELRAR